MQRLLFIILFSLFLSACATHVVTNTQHAEIKLPNNQTKFVTRTETTRFASPAETSFLEQGKQDFTAGYYKRAFHELLPLAVDGQPEAQYAIGYLFYYGYGVNQDTEVGCYWIKRAAQAHFPPAMLALDFINKPHDTAFHLKDVLTK